MAYTGGMVVYAGIAKIPNLETIRTIPGMDAYVPSAALPRKIPPMSNISGMVAHVVIVARCVRIIIFGVIAHAQFAVNSAMWVMFWMVVYVESVACPVHI